jgi:hypothetical protein
MIENDPLSGLSPVRPGPELRERVLRASREALAAARVDATVWERLWRSRPLRLGWISACTALLAGHLVLTLRPELPRAGRVRETSVELYEVLHLPPIERSIDGLEGSLSSRSAGVKRHAT